MLKMMLKKDIGRLTLSLRQTLGNLYVSQQDTQSKRIWYAALAQHVSDRDFSTETDVTFMQLTA